MKTYKITVNGTAYDVVVEETGSQPSNYSPIPSAVQAVSPTPQAPAPSAAPQASPAAKAAPAPAGAGSKVVCPMPGTILAVKVKVGDKVDKNSVVAILEAMKMENEIVTSYAGTVTSIAVSSGDSVNSGDLLVTIAE